MIWTCFLTIAYVKLTCKYTINFSAINFDFFK